MSVGAGMGFVDGLGQAVLDSGEQGEGCVEVGGVVAGGRADGGCPLVLDEA